MGNELNTPLPPEAPHRSLQFSLSSMFLVTTAVAVVCSLTFSMPAVVALPLLVLSSVILAAVLITLIIYGRGYQRTFCIGAVVPFGVLLLTLAFTGAIVFFDGPSSRGYRLSLVPRLVVVGFWMSSILVGAICVGVRKLVEKPRRGSLPPPASHGAQSGKSRFL